MPRSADDLLEVLQALHLERSVLVGSSCAGQVLTRFASPYPDRVDALVYLDGASDPTTPAQDPPMPDPTLLPRPLRPPQARDTRSFQAFSRRVDPGVSLPEAEWRQPFAENPDGSVGRSLLSPVIRQAITVDARVKPDYAGIRVPVVAIYQAQRPFDEVAADFAIRTEEERAALRQQFEATRALYGRWQRDLRAAVPHARIVDLVGANLYMFLSHPADVLREIRALVAP